MQSSGSLSKTLQCILTRKFAHCEQHRCYSWMNKLSCLSLQAALWNGAALFGSKTSDMWGNLHKACDYAAGVCPASCVRWDDLLVSAEWRVHGVCKRCTDSAPADLYAV